MENTLRAYKIDISSPEYLDDSQFVNKYVMDAVTNLNLPGKTKRINELKSILLLLKRLKGTTQKNSKLPHHIIKKDQEYKHDKFQFYGIGNSLENINENQIFSNNNFINLQNLDAKYSEI